MLGSRVEVRAFRDPGRGRIARTTSRLLCGSPGGRIELNCESLKNKDESRLPLVVGSRWGHHPNLTKFLGVLIRLSVAAVGREHHGIPLEKYSGRVLRHLIWTQAWLISSWQWRP